ncbi:hypothetical protein AI2916V1_4763 (plasmid) [Enterobacter cloacae]|nr:hypothetical protein AI2916V1_4763 [Enterobacter cloacae]
MVGIAASGLKALSLIGRHPGIQLGGKERRQAVDIASLVGQEQRARLDVALQIEHRKAVRHLRVNSVGVGQSGDRVGTGENFHVQVHALRREVLRRQSQRLLKTKVLFRHPGAFVDDQRQRPHEVTSRYTGVGTAQDVEQLPLGQLHRRPQA